MTEAWRLLVVGASGAIGGAVIARGRARGWDVVGTSRRSASDAGSDGDRLLRFDPLLDPADVFAGQPPFDAVCWAHGVNLNDSLLDFDVAQHLELYRSNCLSVLVSLAALIAAGRLSPKGARLAVISSIWEQRARRNKLSYTVTKAAIGGLVRSAAVDLGAAGHLINGVLPGVLQTPMTESNLSSDQIARVRGMVSAGRLPDLAAVADTVLFLCSSENTSISGQSITVDLGMNNACLV